MATYSILGRKLQLNTAEDVSEIVAALSEKQFEVIVLSGNTVATEAGQALADAIKDQKELKTLDLSDIFTGKNKDIPAVMSAMKEALLGKESLTALYVADNAFGPDVKTFIDVLPACKNLAHFNTNNTGLGPKGATIIANALAGHTYEELEQKKADEERDAVKLRTFIAGRSRIENGGMLLLAPLFAKMQTLEVLRVPQNGINKEGMLALVKALQVNTRLTELDISDNNLNKGEGADALVTALEALPLLRVVRLGDNNLNRKAALKIVRALRCQDVLEELDLAFCEIDDDVAQVLIDEVLKKAPRLRKVDLNGNKLSKATIATLEEVLEVQGGDLGTLSDNEEDSDDEEEEEDSEGDEATKDEGVDALTGQIAQAHI